MIAEVEFNQETHEYRANGRQVPSVTQVLLEAGIIDRQWYTEFGALRGTYIAEATALFDMGELDHGDLDQQLAPYVAAWAKFRRESGFAIEAIEERVFDPLYGFAGTLDRRGIFNGRPSIIDIKRGTCPAWHGLQTAAYAKATGIVGCDRYCVHLRDNETYSVHKHIDRGDEIVFLSALAVVNWKRRNT